MLEKKQRQIAQTLRWQVKYIPTLFQHGLEKTNWLETVKQLRSVDKLLRRRGRRKERFKNFNWRFERKGSLASLFFNLASLFFQFGRERTFYRILPERSRGWFFSGQDLSLIIPHQSYGNDTIPFSYAYSSYSRRVRIHKYITNWQTLSNETLCKSKSFLTKASIPRSSEFCKSITFYSDRY